MDTFKVLKLTIVLNLRVVKVIIPDRYYNYKMLKTEDSCTCLKTDPTCRWVETAGERDCHGVRHIFCDYLKSLIIENLFWISADHKWQTSKTSHSLPTYS